MKNALMSFIRLFHFKEASSLSSQRPSTAKWGTGAWLSQNLTQRVFRSLSFYWLNDLHIQPTMGGATPIDSLQELPEVEMLKRVYTFEIKTGAVQLKDCLQWNKHN